MQAEQGHPDADTEQAVIDRSRLLRYMDIAIALSILFNIGAVILTNMMVVKAEPSIVFHEVNPVAAKNLGLQIAEGFLPRYLGFILHGLALAVLLGNYVYNRFYAPEKQFKLFLILTIFIFLICTLDFSNNFGYYIGKLLFSV
jgi:hypothetical protein